MAAQLEQLLSSFENIAPKFLVYEADDEALLLSCEAFKNGKSYFSKFPIDFTDLNIIISLLAKQGLDMYENICNSLFDSSSKIREFQFRDVLFSNDTQSVLAA